MTGEFTRGVACWRRPRRREDAEKEKKGERKREERHARMHGAAAAAGKLGRSLVLLGRERYHRAEPLHGGLREGRRRGKRRGERVFLPRLLPSCFRPKTTPVKEKGSLAVVRGRPERTFAWYV